MSSSTFAYCQGLPSRPALEKHRRTDGEGGPCATSHFPPQTRSPFLHSFPFSTSFLFLPCPDPADPRPLASLYCQPVHQCRDCSSRFIPEHQCNPTSPCHCLITVEPHIAIMTVTVPIESLYSDPPSPEPLAGPSRISFGSPSSHPEGVIVEVVRKLRSARRIVVGLR